MTQPLLADFLLPHLSAVLLCETMCKTVDCACCRYNAMQSILAGAVVTLFLFALYIPWFTNKAMLAAILGSFLVNLFLMAGTLEILPDNVSLPFCNPLPVPYAIS